MKQTFCQVNKAITAEQIAHSFGWRGKAALAAGGAVLALIVIAAARKRKNKE